jgi:hydroxymethylpyrimidine pyrophosphatase-like HAD family hydrolase
MNKKFLWVFDIDGTLANNEHRQHHLEKKPKDWKSFFDAQSEDTPHEPVFAVLDALAAIPTNQVIFLTSRDYTAQKETLEFINAHSKHNFDGEELYMRPIGNHVDDDILKPLMLQNILDFHPEWELMAVFDDRNRVIDAFKAKGVYVFNCNQTERIF